MVRVPAIRVAAAVVGGLAATAAMFGLLLVANAGLSRSGALGLGLLPIVAGAVVGTLAWFLLAERDEADDLRTSKSATCATCGSTVLADWRLCPYCGHFIGDEDEPLPPDADS